jgi:hypothetical protein
MRDITRNYTVRFKFWIFYDREDLNLIIGHIEGFSKIFGSFVVLWVFNLFVILSSYFAEVLCIYEGSNIVLNLIEYSGNILCYFILIL